MKEYIINKKCILNNEGNAVINIESKDGQEFVLNNIDNDQEFDNIPDKLWETEVFVKNIVMYEKGEFPLDELEDYLDGGLFYDSDDIYFLMEDARLLEEDYAVAEISIKHYKYPFIVGIYNNRWNKR